MKSYERAGAASREKAKRAAAKKKARRERIASRAAGESDRLILRAEEASRSLEERRARKAQRKTDGTLDADAIIKAALR